MEEIQKELEDWAKKAYDFYYPKAKELDMDFYTQSNLRLISEDEPVHLMVIGINLVLVDVFNLTDSRKVVIYWMGMLSMVTL